MNVTLSGVYIPQLLLRETQFVEFYYHSHGFKISKPDFLVKYHNQDFLMPTTRKHKKAKKTQGNRNVIRHRKSRFYVGRQSPRKEGSEFSEFH